jgi:glycine betaine catabolism A
MSATSEPEAAFTSTLPGKYYYDPAIWELEQQRIFSRLWVCVGRADAIPAPGQFLNVPVGNERVLVVRGRDGVIRAMLNVCRHRGAQLCSEEKGQLRNSIQCKYHAWTYALDGTLIGAPNIMSDEQFDKREFGLWQVAVEVWAGLLWVNLSDEPRPLHEQVIEPVLRRMGSEEGFARYDVGNLKVGKSIEYLVDSNWKLIHENFMECYHCGPMHPELCDLLPAFKAGSVYTDGDGARFAPGVEAFSVTGKASRPPLPGLLPDELNRYAGIVVVPNVLLNLLPDHVVVHTLWPEAPGRTRIVCDWLFHADEVARPDFDPMDAVQVFDITNRQDWEVCELAWKGVQSKVYREGGIYVPIERQIRNLCDWVLEQLESDRGAREFCVDC